MKEKLPLFYWSNIRLQAREKENYGDLLSAYLCEKIAGKPVKWVHPKKRKWFENRRHFLAIGSILGQATTKSHVWGSGIIEKNQDVAPAIFYAVRGPVTRRRLTELQIPCPEIYGDPALLLPDFYTPPVEKSYELGWIPHYTDQKYIEERELPEGHVMIDVNTINVEETTKAILSCRKVISSSLHGLIVAHAYGIPAIWIKISDDLHGDDCKFQDYFESVGIKPYIPLCLEQISDGSVIFKNVPKSDQLPDPERIRAIRKDLLASCPFANE